MTSADGSATASFVQSFSAERLRAVLPYTAALSTFTTLVVPPHADCLRPGARGSTSDVRDASCAVLVEAGTPNVFADKWRDFARSHECYARKHGYGYIRIAASFEPANGTNTTTWPPPREV